MANAKFGVSQASLRKEDDALLRGAGRYVSDYTPAGTLHAVVLRSPHANAEVPHHRRRQGPRDAGRAADHDRRRTPPTSASCR